MKVIQLLAIYRSKLMCGFIISQLYWTDRSVSIEMDGSSKNGLCKSGQYLMWLRVEIIEMGRVKMGYVGVDNINVAQSRNH